MALSDAVYSSMNKGLKLLWDAKATITVEVLPDVKPTGTDNLNKQTEIVVTDTPCKVSSSDHDTPPADGDNLQRQYDALLFLDNGIDVPTGATIYVTDANGVTTKYKRATGTYPSYRSHQEIGVSYDERK